MQYNCKSWPFRSLCSTAPNPEHSGLYAVQLQILSIQILMQYNSKSWPFRSLCSTAPNPEHSDPYTVQLQILSTRDPYTVQLQVLAIQILMQYSSKSRTCRVLIQYNSKSWGFRSLYSTTPNPDHLGSLYDRRIIHYVTAFEYNNIAIMLLTWSPLLGWVSCEVCQVCGSDQLKSEAAAEVF